MLDGPLAVSRRSKRFGVADVVLGQSFEGMGVLRAGMGDAVDGAPDGGVPPGQARGYDLCQGKSGSGASLGASRSHV